LYWQKTGHKVIGFIWYHLRSGKWFFTLREEDDFAELLNAIAFVRDNVEEGHFPKRPRKDSCPTCPYLVPCNEDRYFLISRGEDPTGDLITPEMIPNLIEKDPNQQLKLKLKVPKPKREPPSVQPVAYPVIRQLPWDLPPDETPQGPSRRIRREKPAED
jgi:hypothetical protein